ncbi:family 71 glycosyl hydrolase [Colletotrichum navitas]|uniref:Family 71 glycosyl hydrolase n=1 Tax=Colletotrichum navitas TaxID=681940 RepID=A0AAD8PNB0_9PEZI|nr:family 71 glycosyl hydrolase [Colletotrichum navitas]KAK1573339.1 family 71 glycosyl hydrolase [Colletotrichum navitas]
MRKFFKDAKKKIEAEIAAISGDDEPQQQQQQQQQYPPPPQQPGQGFERAVFAHFMLSNTCDYTVDEFKVDIVLAQEAHIDAFVLNFGIHEEAIAKLPDVFAAAEQTGFKLLISFDYEGAGAWPKERVIDIVSRFGPSPAYFKRGWQPVVSTFEGVGSAADWHEIKAATGCFFIPSFSSVGAENAIKTGVADGLFSWAAWPHGNSRKLDEGLDASYRHFLGPHRPYMVAVSPWFYTNLPTWNKNWAWKGDDLWNDRWNEILAMRPEYVQILTWNDFGESHYIGPLHEKQFGAFEYGRAPFNYVRDMPHDGWRLLLPFLIDLYKYGTATITKEGLVTWYRLHPGDAGDSGGTTGNTSSHGQELFHPAEIMEDKIVYSALLTGPAQVTVSVGGVAEEGSWDEDGVPKGGVGVYHGSVPFNGRTGEVVVTVHRGSEVAVQVQGRPITTECSHGGMNNWNAWVGAANSHVGTHAVAHLG